MVENRSTDPVTFKYCLLITADDINDHNLPHVLIVSLYFLILFILIYVSLVISFLHSYVSLFSWY